MESNTNKLSKKQIIVIVSLLVAILIIGTTIAYFMSRQTGNEQTITSGNLSITYTNENAFNLTSIIPLAEEDIKNKAAKIDFTVTNNGNMKTYIQIDIVDIQLTKLKDYDFKWALYNEDTKITTGSFISEEDGIITLMAGEELEAGANKNYSVYAWINETPEDQGDLMGGIFKGKIQVTGYGKNNTLANAILNGGTSYINEYNWSDCGPDTEGLWPPDGYCKTLTNVSMELDKTINTTPNFSRLSEDRGLYVQKDDSEKSNFGFPTYYYRGEVINNYVNFAGQIWRIVRINEDGSIRIITDDNKLNLTKNFPSSKEYVKSIADEVTPWYEANITGENDKKVQIGEYCSDISGFYIEKEENPDGSITEYEKLDDNKSAVTRLGNNNATFRCPKDGEVINKKALTISGDEVFYSGINTSGC